MKFNDQASCKYLTHTHASFHGCTVDEMAMILGIYALIEIPIMLLLATILAKYLGGFLGALLLLFLVFAMLTFFVLLRITAKRIGRIRKGRAAGYLKLRFRQFMYEQFGVSHPYITRNGHWSTRRRI